MRDRTEWAKARYRGRCGRTWWRSVDCTCSEYGDLTLPFIDYRDLTTTIISQDELAIMCSCAWSCRLRHTDLRLPPPILPTFHMLMDEPFLILEHRSLSSTTKEDTNLILHSCSKTTPLNARRHRSSKKCDRSLPSLSSHSCSRTPYLLLISP